MTTAAYALIAIAALAGAVVWIVLLLWAARRDGQDQRAYDDALEQYRRDHDHDHDGH
jgi:hypothetical protein